MHLLALLVVMLFVWYAFMKLGIRVNARCLLLQKDLSNLSFQIAPRQDESSDDEDEEDDEGSKEGSQDSSVTLRRDDYANDDDDYIL